MKLSLLMPLLLGVALLSSELNAQGMVRKWAARYDGPGNGKDQAHGLAVDSSGNVIVTGESPGVGTGLDFATVKYDPDGNLLWAARYNGPGNGNDVAWAVAIGPGDTIFVTGESYGSTSNDYATVKYDPAGNQMWVARYDSPGHYTDYARAMAVNSSGVFVTGGSPTGTTSFDFTTIKYDFNLNQLWVTRYDGPGNSRDIARFMALDSSGNIYVSGNSGTTPNIDYATVKYDSGGNQVWASHYIGPAGGNDIPSAVAVDSSGNVFVTGQSDGGATRTDYATIKYDSSGNELWVLRHASTGAVDDLARDCAIDGEGNVLVTGASLKSLTFDYVMKTFKYAGEGVARIIWKSDFPGTGSGLNGGRSLAIGPNDRAYVTGDVAFSGSDYDIATVKYGSGESDGMELWSDRYDGPASGPDVPAKVAVDSLGRAYVAGSSTGIGTDLDFVTIKYVPDIAAPSSLTCGHEGGTIFLSWTNNDSYDYLKVFRDGEEIATLSEPYERDNYNETMPGGAYFYEVYGFKGDEASEPASCLEDNRPPAVLELSCDYDYDSGMAILFWSNADDYTGIEVWRDGQFIETLPGGENSFREERNEPGAATYAVIGIYADVPSESRECVVTIELMPPSELACESFGRQVRLSWTNRFSYDTIDVFRNQELASTIPGDSTSFIDRIPGIGAYTYRLQGWAAGSYETSGDCIVEVPPALELGVPVSFSLVETLPEKAFRLALPEWSSALITLSDPDAADANALFLRWGDLPEPALFDQAAQERNRADQKLAISSAWAADAVILARATKVHGGSNEITLLATAVDLALEEISVKSMGSGEKKSLSAEIKGAGFRPDTAFSLKHKESAATFVATEKVQVSKTRAEAVFKLEGAPLGKYDLKAVNPGNIQAALEEAFEIKDTRKGPIPVAGLAVPPRCRSGRLATMSLWYENAGDEEMTAPLFKIVGPPETDLRLESQAEFQGNVLQVLGVDPRGVAGKLSPGAYGEITVVFENRGDRDAAFELCLFTPTHDDAVRWETVALPDGMIQADWGALWPALSVNAGSLWLDYQEALAERATRFSRRNADPASVRDLFRFLVREAYGRPSSAVAGQVREAATGAPVDGAAVLALLGGVVKSSAITDGAGFYSIDWLREGEVYDLRMMDFSHDGVSVTALAGSDVLGVDLLVSPVANHLVPGCPNCDEAGLPSKPLLPPDRLFTRISNSSMKVVTSFDPNEKAGPAGESGNVGPGEELLYTIYFENLKTGPNITWAQRVTVTDQLVPDLDWSTLRLRDIRLGTDNLFSLDMDGEEEPAPLLSDGFGGNSFFIGIQGRWALEVLGNFDPLTGKAEWVFQTLDAETGKPPDPVMYPDAGFLPPDDPDPLKNDHQGEGHVTLTVKPKEDLLDGTEITNEATINFDGRTVSTNAWTNTISRTISFDVPRNPYPRSETAYPVEIRTGFLWQSNAECYDVYLWKEGSPPVPMETSIGSCSYKPLQALEFDKVYHWQVGAWKGGVEKLGETWTFKTMKSPAPPGKPSNPNPASGAQNVPRRPTLKWSLASGASYYEVFFWSHGKARPGLPVAMPSKNEFPLTGDLNLDKEYDWQVVAVSASSEGDLKSPGDPWTFRTATVPFRRGDANSDGSQDLSDAVFGLFYFFLGSPAPDCVKALDTNDDGETNLTDVIYLLAHLFLDDLAPPAPYPSCGLDLTEDDLGCVSYIHCGS